MSHADRNLRPSVRRGHQTGGDTPNATYRNHGSHAEAIEVRYTCHFPRPDWKLPKRGQW